MAAAHGATATLEMMPAPNPVLVNDPALTESVTASLERALGARAVRTSSLLTVAEDYALIARAVPSVYWWVGVTPASQDPASAPDNHSDRFYVDEAASRSGLRSLLRAGGRLLQAPAAARPGRQQIDREAAKPVAAFVMLAGDGGQGRSACASAAASGRAGADLPPEVLTPCRAASRRGSG